MVIRRSRPVNLQSGHLCGLHVSRVTFLLKRTLRVYPVNHAREGNHLANVLGAANPRDSTLQPQTEAGMRHATVAPQVEVPLKGFFRKVVFTEPLDEQLVIVDALAAADDFAVAFGREHVEGQGKFGALWVGLHVESFERRGIAMHDQRAVERTRMMVSSSPPKSSPNLAGL